MGSGGFLVSAASFDQIGNEEDEQRKNGGEEPLMVVDGAEEGDGVVSGDDDPEEGGECLDGLVLSDGPLLPDALLFP